MNRFVKHLIVSLLIAFGSSILLFILLYTGPAMLFFVPALVIPFPLVLWYYGLSDAKSIGEGIGFSFLYFFSWVIGMVILAVSRYPWVGFGGYQSVMWKFQYAMGDVDIYNPTTLIFPGIVILIGLLVGFGLFGAACGYINKKK